MKKIIAIIGAFMLMAAPLTMNADNQKAAKKELDSKSSKTARKEAKKLEKEGWKAASGALPLEKQLDRSYLKQQEEDDWGYPKFMMSEAMSIGEIYDAAKMQALELAKQNLAGQIQSEVTTLIESSVANKQLPKEEAASLVESTLSCKSLISQKIGKTITVVELYRTLPNKNKEVLLRLAYNMELAKEAARQAIREDLEQKGKDLHEQLDKALGFAK